MLRKGSIVWVFLFAHFVSTHAQSAYHFMHLTMDDGLNDAKIRAIAEDKYGSMWFGEYGLNRYNGHTMESFTSDSNDSTSLPDIDVLRMYCSRSGQLYISTFTGFCRYDYVHHHFENYPFGLNAKDSRILETDDGILWMNSDLGLVIVDENKNTYTELSKHTDPEIRKISTLRINDFATDHKETIYLGTSSGLIALNYKTWASEIFTHEEKDTSSIKSNDVTNVGVDQKGIVWFSTDYYGSNLVRFDPVTERFSYFDQLHTLRKEWIDNRIIDLLLDQKGRLWIATLRSGLALFDTDNGEFSFFLHDENQPTSISSNEVYTITEDSHGLIWLSTLNSGVDFFSPDNNHFTTISKSSFKTSSLVDNQCQSVTEDRNGNLWIGTYQGLSFYNREDQTYTNYLPARQQSQDANNSIRSLQADETGTIWIGTGHGLNRWDPATQKIEPVNTRGSVPAIYISYLTFDSDHRLMIGTSRGLYFYHPDQKKFESVFDRPVLSKYKNVGVSAIQQDRKGRYWFNASIKGVVVYDPASETEHLYTFDTLLGSTSALTYFTSIAEDEDGVMWLSTNFGLISFDYEKQKIRAYFEADGLPSNKTSGLLMDSLNRLWIATNKGLCVLDTDRQHLHVLDEKDGLSTTYFYEGRAYQLRDGTFVYPTYNGIVMFDPEKINITATTVPFSIASIRSSNQKITGDVPVQEVKKIRLRSNQNFFTIELEGLNFINPEGTYFAYILEGLNEHWTYTSERMINYTNVPGGKYIFRYKATNDPKNWNVPEKQLEIFIGTVFYKTSWFITLIALCLAGMLFGFFRFRILQQQRMYALESRTQKLEKEKALAMYENLMQQLNPHFLFNSLTSLRSLIRIDQKHAGEFLDQMSKIYRYILKSRDTELVLLKDEINFAQTYIDLQQTRFQKGLQVEIHVDEEYLDRKIVPVTLQNLMDNAIKHNQIDAEFPLVIRVFQEGGYLVVENNLQRKDFVETSNKQGLQNMISLYQYLDPRPIDIIASESHFTIKIPLI